MRKIVQFAIVTFMLATGHSAMAQTLPFKPIGKPTEWSLDIGGGPIYGFSSSGGRTDQVNFTAWGSFNWHDRLYANGLDGLGYNIVKTDKVRAGVQLRPRFASGSTIEGLDLPGFGADAAAYGYVRVGDNIAIGGRLTHEITNQGAGTSLWLTAGHQVITPVGLFQTTLYSSFGDAENVHAYYSINASRAAATGLHLFEAKPGLLNAGAALLWMIPVGKHYAMGSFINVERTLGSVADSPLIEAAPNEQMAYRGGVIVIRRFGAPLR